MVLLNVSSLLPPRTGHASAHCSAKPVKLFNSLSDISSFAHVNGLDMAACPRCLEPHRLSVNTQPSSLHWPSGAGYIIPISHRLNACSFSQSFIQYLLLGFTSVVHPQIFIANHLFGRTVSGAASDLSLTQVHQSLTRRL